MSGFPAVKNDKYHEKLAQAVKELEALRPNRYAAPEVNGSPPDPAVDLTVIVPVFNTENYVLDCVHSILEQKTAYAMQIILVNDGSTDSSASRIACLEASPGVTVIHTENRGISAARNTGLDLAVGRYIMFVDSDDILPKDCVQRLVETAERYSASLVGGNFRTFTGSQEISQEGLGTSPADMRTISGRAGILSLPGYVWGKVYDRRLFSGCRFPLNLEFEDTLVHLLLYPKCAQVMWISDVVYFYRKNPNGISATHQRGNRSIDTLWVVEALLKQRKRLKLEIDAADYAFLLGQLSWMTCSRMLHYPLGTLRAAFYVGCEILRQNQPDVKVLSLPLKYLDSAFINRRFWQWMICSGLMLFQRKASFLIWNRAFGRKGGGC